MSEEDLELHITLDDPVEEQEEDTFDHGQSEPNQRLSRPANEGSHMKRG